MSKNGRELAHELGITTRQFDYWAGKGWLTGKPWSPGSGSPRLLNDEQARRATLVMRLARAGVHPSTASWWADNLLEHGSVAVDTVDGTAIRVTLARVTLGPQP